MRGNRELRLVRARLRALEERAAEYRQILGNGMLLCAARRDESIGTAMLDDMALLTCYAPEVVS